MVPPPLPEPPTIEYADDAETVDDLIHFLNYHVVKGWKKPDSLTSNSLASQTYALALGLSWKGHMSNWNNCILSGKMIAGYIDKTPKKIKDLQMTES